MHQHAERARPTVTRAAHPTPPHQHTTRQAFAAYLANALPASQHARIARHLAHCGRCATRLVAYLQEQHA
jgi:anti-sigma factor RsiW